MIDIRAHLSRLLNAHYGASCPAHDPAYLAGCALMQALPAGERVTAAEAWATAATLLRLYDGVDAAAYGRMLQSLCIAAADLELAAGLGVVRWRP